MRDIRREYHKYRDAYQSTYQLVLDLRREVQKQSAVVLCLDFSEIFPLIVPQPRDHGTLRMWTAIRSGRQRFTLPPSAVYELLEFIRIATSDLSGTSKAVSDNLQSFYNLPQVKEFLSLIRDEPQPKRIADLWSKWGAEAPLRQLIKSRSRHISQIRSVAYLDNFLSNLVDPLSELVDTTNTDFDDIAFDRAIRDLSVKRPAKAKQNFLDALNFAFLMRLNNNSIPNQGRYFALLLRIRLMTNPSLSNGTILSVARLTRYAQRYPNGKCDAIPISTSSPIVLPII